jgi:predicted TIM-barrel fold metal-dependent hydrolase
VYLAISEVVDFFPVMPRWVHETLGKALMFVGPDRLLYGTESFIWSNAQAFIDTLAEMEMPEDLQDGYGYPPVLPEFKRKMFGENLARLLGVDIAP